MAGAAGSAGSGTGGASAGAGGNSSDPVVESAGCGKPRSNVAEGNNGATPTPCYGLWDLARDSTIFVALEGIDQGWANPDGADVAFTDAILEQLPDDLCIDTTRIFANGFSYGGEMSYAISCARADVFRAVAVYSAAAMRNGCTAQTAPEPEEGSGGHLCTTYDGRSPGYPVRWCAFDGGHTPSPIDEGQATSWVPEETWSFFGQY